MASYRVRAGRRLSHLGEVLEGGTAVELDPALAADKAVEHLVEPDPPPARGAVRKTAAAGPAPAVAASKQTKEE